MVPCSGDYVGSMTAKCLEGGSYGNKQNNCVLSRVNELLSQSTVRQSSGHFLYLIFMSNVIEGYCAFHASLTTSSLKYCATFSIPSRWAVLILKKAAGQKQILDLNRPEYIGVIFPVHSFPVWISKVSTVYLFIDYWPRIWYTNCIWSILKCCSFT